MCGTNIKKKLFYLSMGPYYATGSHVLCVCESEEGSLHSVYDVIGAMFHIYESELHG
jgi:hypothetical protein